MEWYVIDKSYVKYLREFDNKVEYIEYEDKVKLFLGIICYVNGFDYYVPISSAKPKHQKMKNSQDFLKLVNHSGVTLAVLNLNNMIPINHKSVIKLLYSEIDKYRAFASELDKTNYIHLLQSEKLIIDGMQTVIEKKALKLHEMVITYPESTLASRCCDFKLLESKCSVWDDLQAVATGKTL